jgi:hypothetical protein
MWRVSVLIAAALIGASLWYAYELARTIQFFADIADYLGMPEAMQWGNIALLFATVGIFGVFLPAFYICRVWSRDFPRTLR